MSVKSTQYIAGSLFAPTRFLCLFMLLLLCITDNIYAKKKERKVKASESIPMLDEFISVKTYKELAIGQAIKKALDKEFGSTVLSNYENIKETRVKDGSVDLYNDFRFSYINTFPNGKWIKELTSPSFEQYQDANGLIWIKCTVEGMVHGQL